MNENRMASIFWRRQWAFVPLFVLVCALLAPPVLAQQASAPAPTAEQAAGATVGLAELADLLENDTTRAQLIQTLRSAASEQVKQQAPAQQKPAAATTEAQNGQAAAAKTGDAAQQAAQQSATAEKVSPVRQLARATGAWAENIGVRAKLAWATVASLWGSSAAAGGALLPTFDAAVFWSELLKLALVIIATLVAYFILRMLARAVFAPLEAWPKKGATFWSRMLSRCSAVVLALITDVVVVLLACAAGYVVGLALLGKPGVIGTRATLFVNAFAVVELVKVVIRALFSSHHANLRLLNMPDSVAGWWSIRLRWFVGVVGYCLLLAVPIINAQLSPAIGAVVSFIVMAAAFIYALRVVFGNRKLLTQRLLKRADNASLGFFAVVQRILARVWLPLAVVYLTVLFVGSQLDGQGVLPFMMVATVKTLVAAAIALALSGLLSRALGKRITVSERTRQRLPRLEARLNSYVPVMLKTARFIILLALALVLMDAWHLFDLDAWLASAAGVKVVGVVFHLLVVFAVAVVLWIIAASLLEHKLGIGADGGAPSPRQDTLLVLIRNALAILVVTMTVMIALSQIGVDIGPMLAGAGVVGLAIGFGAQKLVADVITGVFIQIENAMNTGDWVTVAGVMGGVEKLTIRSVSLRALDGTLHVVPFSSASIVSNYNREFGYHVTSYRIAYREDIDEAVRQLRLAYEDLEQEADVRPNLLDEFLVPGVTSLAENAVEIRVMIKTAPGMQWSVGRAYNRLVKMRFDSAGIEIPTAQRTLYFGRDKDGWSPPARIRMVDTKKVALRADEDHSNDLDTSGRQADGSEWGGADGA